MVLNNISDNIFLKMGKHIKKFENEAAYDVFKASEEFVTPNVSWCVEEDIVKYNLYVAPVPPVHDYSQDYFTIVSTSDNNTIGWRVSSSNLTETISISTDNGQTWVDKTSSTSGTELVTLNNGDKILIKGNNYSYGGNTGSDYNYFTSSDTFDVEGNIMSLIYGDDFIGQPPLSSWYNFIALFGLSKVVNAINLVLPATTLADYCYYRMFYGCTSLTTAPALPATTLANRCYRYMFSGCTGLNYIKCLATDISANGCLSSWVSGVAASGTFVKNPSMNSWPTGESGIPSGWTVQDAS